MKNNLYFFIGTDAELIKVFPVIMECQKKGKICHIIASGQNDIKKNRILSFIKLNGRFLELSHEAKIVKSARGLFTWFIHTYRSAPKFILKNYNINELANAPLIVHGDTISTLMGALIGKKLHMTVCHIEAGLRSHHLFNPFPEEIDRLLTSGIARVHFAPGQEAVQNLRRAKGKVIDTGYNTIYDSLCISATMPIITENLNTILTEDFFVFVLHRQENLANRNWVKQIVVKISEIAENKKCVLLLHKITQNVLNEIGLLEQLKMSDRFYLLPRIDYFDFMKLLSAAKFVITDGGSNQEELCYMGKPCLIMRKTTERREGIGKNAVMFNGDVSHIQEFAKQYLSYQINPARFGESPSFIISDILKQI